MKFKNLVLAALLFGQVPVSSAGNIIRTPAPIQSLDVNLNLSDATGFYRAVTFGASLSGSGFKRVGSHRSEFDTNDEIGTQIYDEKGFGILVYMYVYTPSVCYFALGHANGSGWNHNPLLGDSVAFINKYSKISLVDKNRNSIKSYSLTNGPYYYNNGVYKELSMPCSEVLDFYGDHSLIKGIRLHN